MMRAGIAVYCSVEGVSGPWSNHRLTEAAPPLAAVSTLEVTALSESAPVLVGRMVLEQPLFIP